MGQRASDWDAGAYGESAVVFSPHADDETLGCGGTLIRKRQAGADVHVVFMADGRTSHAPWLDPKELNSRRTAEAINACGVLGIDRANVTFLNLEEGRLMDQRAAAVPRVVEILDRHRPEQVFVPSEYEPTADHYATHQIVFDAIRACGRPVTIFEYLIWFWGFWPWSTVTDPAAPGLLGGLRMSLRHSRYLFGKCRSRVFVGELLVRKRTALEQHRTQMFQLVPDPQYPTLADVWQGAFLRCCFQEYEFFRRRVVQSW